MRIFETFSEIAVDYLRDLPEEHPLAGIEWSVAELTELSHALVDDEELTDSIERAVERQACRINDLRQPVQWVVVEEVTYRVDARSEAEAIELVVEEGSAHFASVDSRTAVKA